MNSLDDILGMIVTEAVENDNLDYSSIDSKNLEYLNLHFLTFCYHIILGPDGKYIEIED